MVDVKPGQVWKRNGPDKYVLVKRVDDDGSVIIQKCDFRGLIHDPLRFLRVIPLVRLQKNYIYIKSNF